MRTPYLVAPEGVTLEGAGLQDLVRNPARTRTIFGLAANAYRIKLTAPWGNPLCRRRRPGRPIPRGTAQDSRSRIEVIPRAR